MKSSNRNIITSICASDGDCKQNYEFFYKQAQVTKEGTIFADVVFEKMFKVHVRVKNVIGVQITRVDKVYWV